MRNILLEKQIVNLGAEPYKLAVQLKTFDTFSSPQLHGIELPRRRAFNTLQEVDNVVNGGSDTEPDYDTSFNGHE
jgi:hypothetical protein